MNTRRRSGMTLIELLVVMAILAILSGAIAAVALRAGGRPWRVKCLAGIAKLEMALDRYRGRFRKYPPDTGYGLRMTGMRPSYTKTVGGVDIEVPTYDPGSLWRYLCNRVYDTRTKEWHGPFLEEWPQEQMTRYEHTTPSGVVVKSFYLADPWGNPYGFIGTRKRVLHNQGFVDIFSAGSDGTTACNNDQIDNDEGISVDSCSDNPQSQASFDNQAYNTADVAGKSAEVDDDDDGSANNASEFGPEASLNGDVGDDLNNWSPH